MSTVVLAGDDCTLRPVHKLRAEIPDRITLVKQAVATSTNAVAQQLVLNGKAPDWTVVTADRQTSGRGRHGRRWMSPAGNLYSSTIVFPDRPQRSWAQLSLVAALAVADLARTIVPAADVTLKWPNDVLIGGRKLGGILLETGLSDHTPDALIIGTGINVEHAPLDMPYGATSLNAEAAVPVRVEDCLARYLQGLVHWHDVWLESGFAPVRRAWLERAHGLGMMVEIAVAEGRVCRGRFIGLAPDGLMECEGADGRIRFISSGSVRFTDGEVR